MMTIPLNGAVMWQPLREVRTLTGQLVDHFVDNIAGCATLPGDAISGDITTVTRMCVEIVGGVIDGKDVSEKVRRLAEAAAGWAREGVPIDSILHAFYEGLRLSLNLEHDGGVALEPGAVIDGLHTAMAVSDLLSTTVARAYIREYRAVAGQHHTAVHALTAALLAGQPNSAMARECGIGVAEVYHVVALSIREHPDEHDKRLNAGVVARRKLRRVQSALARSYGERALSLLSVDGGTVLIPGGPEGEDTLDTVVAELSQSARAEIMATLIGAKTADIPDAAKRAHELLDVVERLDWTPGLYRFNDLALEYQLTRPGPGQARLGEILAPLDNHPDLYETLRVHIANNLNRRRTARVLHIHTNTVDYRMRRITHLTGIDPSHSSGLWQLRAGMIARSYNRGTR